MVRKSRPIHIGAGALMLAIPASAAALAAGQADTKSAIQINAAPRQIVFGHALTVTGSTASTNAGHPLELQLAPAGATTWRAVGSTKVGGDGRFRVVAPVKQSGLVRVIGAVDPRTLGAVSSSGSSAIAPSAARPFSVAAKFRVPRASINVLGGHRGHVRGRLLPEVPGRKVRLQGHASGAWHTLATARTGSRGGFDVRYTPGGTGRQSLRVSFAGDRRNGRASAPAGQLTVFRESLASWYDDGGATACGFHANFGVANRDLPCGTKVTFHAGGHTVTAAVDDRGPYVGGREWDLNQNTAGALGFGGVGTVWSSR
jgi:peptidoglycan lytic transglycosylase